MAEHTARRANPMGCFVLMLLGGALGGVGGMLVGLAYSMEWGLFEAPPVLPMRLWSSFQWVGLWVGLAAGAVWAVVWWRAMLRRGRARARSTGRTNTPTTADGAVLGAVLTGAVMLTVTAGQIISDLNYVHYLLRQSPLIPVVMLALGLGLTMLAGLGLGALAGGLWSAIAKPQPPDTHATPAAESPAANNTDTDDNQAPPPRQPPAEKTPIPTPPPRPPQA